MPGILERDLYEPIREYLAGQGYEVKSEVGHCDVVARRGTEPVVVVEIKTKLNLELILQATDRLALTDAVYVAFPGSAPLWRRHWRRVRGLCRRLGIGLMTLEGPRRTVRVRLDPAPYRPRQDRRRQDRLLGEFSHRVGDPNVGGVSRTELMTAYRQDALRLVAALGDGPLPLEAIRAGSGVVRAAPILQKDHYGWFERVARGTYRLSPKGLAAADRFSDALAALSDAVR